MALGLPVRTSEMRANAPVGIHGRHWSVMKLRPTLAFGQVCSARRCYGAMVEGFADIVLIRQKPTFLISRCKFWTSVCSYFARRRGHLLPKQRPRGLSL